ncbi:hypothetical protein C8R43DRAFT_1153204 [Mycena crocata]|nr:hypothetical protein C8R43DRAFT_1153204 [Mycena crocata]
MAAAASPRRTHRKRISALRLSSDTTTTLPEYIGWRDVVPPPEYEADEDTDSEPPAPYIPPTPVSPRLHTRHSHHRRRASSPQQSQDVFLDSLLERSVHALELSNALLQSSMTTPGSSAFREPSPTSAVAVPPAREAWADDLDAIARDVDDLLVSSSLPSTVSASPRQHRRPRRRPSLDPDSTYTALSAKPPPSRSNSHSHSNSYAASTHSNQSTLSSGSGLNHAPQPRARLVAPAPRAMTQYVDAQYIDAGADDGTIALPSTLGLRAPPSDWRDGLPALPHFRDNTLRPSDGLPSHHHHHRDATHYHNRDATVTPAAAPREGLPSSFDRQIDWHPAPLAPTLSARSPEPSTPAYAMLSAFVQPAVTSPKLGSTPSTKVGSAASSANNSKFASSSKVASPKGGSASSSKINGVSSPKFGTSASSASPKFGTGTSASSPKFPPAASRTASASRSSSRGRGGSRTPPVQQRSRSADAYSASGANVNFAFYSTASGTGNASVLTLHPNASSAITLHPNASSAITLHPNASAISISHTLPSESPAHSPQSSDDGGECDYEYGDSGGAGGGSNGGNGSGGRGGGGGCRAKAARSALRTILERVPVGECYSF